MDLSRKRVRERLKISREPYWQKLQKGAFLGFRRGADTWIARYRNRAGKQEYNALEGVVEFDEAKQTAEAWFVQMGAGATRTTRRGTVADALQAYLGWLREQGRATGDVEWRFNLTVFDDLLAALRLEDVTREDVHEWRKRLQPGRANRTVNRLVRSVTAGVNRALRSLGFTGNAEAWGVGALADDREEEGTAVFLTGAQRQTLVGACEPALAAFLRGLEHTGARPGELAAATVGDLNGDTLTLRHRKGRPAKLRSRAVILSADAVTFFRQLARRKLPAAPLLTDPAGVAWRRHTWSRAITAAIAEANKKARGTKRIPPGASAYSFRHARISELLQLHGVDPLTVAQQTGTSLAMIEKAYFKFIATAMREKLAAIKGAQP